MHVGTYAIYKNLYVHMSLLRYKYKRQIKASAVSLNYNLRGVAPIDQHLMGLDPLLMRVIRGRSDFGIVLTVPRVQVLCPAHDTL
jgi:hypothetical protein